MKRILAGVVVLLAIGAFVVIATGSSNGPSNPSYKLEFDNAFGLVPSAPLKVAGVPAGKITSIDLCSKDPAAHCQNRFHALVTVSVTTTGFGQFHSDASCQTRPQSLIGEYFIDCQPGQNGKVLKPGATLPASHTFSTIPADLLANIMRLPQRERFTLIINELGAAVAARSEDLQTALRRAVPALDQTDNLLNLLANDSHTLQQLTSNSNAVIGALAQNKTKVQNFIVQANRAATDTAVQQANLRLTLQRLPPFLEQLRPAMVKLGAASDANAPVVANLNAASGQLHRLFTNLAACSHPHNDHQCGFADASKPALASLGQASVTGTPAMQAAAPTVALLNKFAKPTPELAQNLAIVLGDLDNRSRAVEPDSRSPGGAGFTGLEALLQYAFNQTLAINYFGQFGHMLAVDAFANPMCSPYATPGTVAANLKQYGPAYRQCYSWLGPNQPGLNQTDPSNPGGCVPDPGGAPPGHTGPATTAPACQAQPLQSLPPTVAPSPPSGGGGGLGGLPLPLKQSGARSGASPSGSGSGSSTPAAGGSATSVPSAGLPSNAGSVAQQVASGLAPAAPSPSTSGSAAGASAPASGQAQQLLNYLLSP